MIHRIFLDANVLLSAAFDRNGFPSLLGLAKSEFSFVTTEYAIGECERSITRRAPDERRASGVRQLLRKFIERFGLVIVPEPHPRAAAGVKDPEDLPIYLAAVESGCDVICTYNLQHFLVEDIRVLPPLGVLNLLENRGVLPVHVEVQRPILGATGTLLVLGHFRHPSSIGRILRTGEDSRIFADREGFIQVEGHTSGHFTARALLQAERVLAFVLRYKSSGQFDAVMWLSAASPGTLVTRADLTRVVLTDGHVPFVEPVTAQLVFEPDHQFFASVVNISAIPLYVRDSQIPFVYSSGSLECLVGSRGVEEIFERVTFRNVGGETYVGLKP
jgi:predicted nucleic acid-binding protein